MPAITGAMNSRVKNIPAWNYDPGKWKEMKITPICGVYPFPLPHDARGKRPAEVAQLNAKKMSAGFKALTGSQAIDWASSNVLVCNDAVCASLLHYKGILPGIDTVLKYREIKRSSFPLRFFKPNQLFLNQLLYFKEDSFSFLQNPHLHSRFVP